MSIVVPGTIGKDSGIQQFSATGTLPSIKRTDKIIEFFSEHTPFATWTMHRFPPDYSNKTGREVYTFYVPTTQTILPAAKTMKYIEYYKDVRSRYEAFRISFRRSL